MRLSTLLLLLLPWQSNAQYNGPESVEHDAAGQRYFISNTGSNTILQRDYDGTVTTFVDNLPSSPYGLELKGDTLFACIGGSIEGFDRSTGTLVFNLDVGGSFLNGITTDGRSIYVTDFSAKTILKIDPGMATFQTLVTNTGSTPNGITWDPETERLWVACWGSNAKIKSYDRVTGAELSSYITNLTNLDGITLDCLGRIIVSSWSPARLSRFENTFTQAPVDLLTPDLSNPADIDFDVVNNFICVPNSGSNSVSFQAVGDCTLGLSEPTGYTRMYVRPNPNNGTLTVNLDLKTSVPFLVYTLRGNMVASGTLTPNGALDLRQLAPGTYVIDVPSLRRMARVIRQ
ncbi:MAG: T9SS type A sorting domain-containing protein [Flavobacteriales bacterium]